MFEYEYFLVVGYTVAFRLDKATQYIIGAFLGLMVWRIYRTTRIYLHIKTNWLHLTPKNLHIYTFSTRPSFCTAFGATQT